MATAELAAALPVLVILLGAGLGAISVASAQVRVQDAAAQAARLAGRGDQAGAKAIASQVAPGSRVQITVGSDQVSAGVRITVHPAGPLLPSIVVQASAVAASEPSP